MRGHVRKRGSTWSIVVDKGRNAEGRRRQQWLSGYRTKSEAEAALHRIVDSLNTGSYVEPAKVTTGAYLLDWVSSITDVRPSTRASYKANIVHHVNPRLGQLPVAAAHRPSPGRALPGAPAPGGGAAALPAHRPVRPRRRAPGAKGRGEEEPG